MTFFLHRKGRGRVFIGKELEMSEYLEERVKCKEKKVCFTNVNRKVVSPASVLRRLRELDM